MSKASDMPASHWLEVLKSTNTADRQWKKCVKALASKGLLAVRVLVNDYSSVDPGYGARLRNLLEENGLEVETMPLFRDQARRRLGDLPSAVGLYINYLRVGDVVIVPAYDAPEDEIAVETVRQVLPNVTVR